MGNLFEGYHVLVEEPESDGQNSHIFILGRIKALHKLLETDCIISSRL